MRETTAWRKNLAAQLKAAAETYPDLKHVDMGRVLDTELVLTLFTEHLPDEDPQMAWAILGGQPFPARASLSDAALRAIAIVRQRLARSLSRDAWTNDLLRTYRTLPSPFPLYRIERGKVIATRTVLVPERLPRMLDILHMTVPQRERKARFAPGDASYGFKIRGVTYEVQIPAFLTEQVQRFQGVEPPRGTPTRGPIAIRWDELTVTARWMDFVAPAGSLVAKRSWATWCENQAELLAITEDGLVPTALLLDGTIHLVGMVGAGKSTLFTIVTVHLVRLGYRVGIVHGDVATIMRDLQIFTDLGKADARIKPVPLIGRGNRLQHRLRLYAAEAWDHAAIQLASPHIGHRALSTVCLLDGLRRDQAPIPIGQEPCTALYPQRDGEETVDEKQLMDCPLMPVCPVHATSRALADATIWLATPASMLASKPQAPLIKAQMSYVELMVRSLDVLLIDEADRVQIQFDRQFAQIELLTGPPEALLDSTGRQVAEHAYRPGRPLIKRDTQRWLTAHANIQRSIDRIYLWLREQPALGSWLIEQGYFNGERLLKHIGRDRLRPQPARVTDDEDDIPHAQAIDGDHADWRWFEDLVDAFCTNPLGAIDSDSPDLALWGRTLQNELVSFDGQRSHALLRTWLLESPLSKHLPDDLTRDKYTMRLLVGLLTTLLDSSLHQIIQHWGDVEDIIDLSKGSGALFMPPDDSLARLMPEPPMGTALGLLYYDPQNSGHGEIRFFRVLAQGRWLLYHLHDVLQLSDQIAGPHVVLTSGTSVASSTEPEQETVDGRGSSWLYDLHIPPQLLLRPKERAKEDISERPRIRAFFASQIDPDDPQRRLEASGKSGQKRLRAMNQMVEELARKRAGGKSLFNQHLAQLPADRQRALICVGRYEEAISIAQTLNTRLGEGTAVAMVRDQIDDEMILELRPGTIVRSRVEDVVKLPVTFLVAPLLSIERGFNLVLPETDGRAAFGAIYFLARPLPVPGDAQTAMHRVHAWAQRYVPRMRDLSLSEAGALLRKRADERWRGELNRNETYTGSLNRTDLLWTELVIVCQAIGRLLRGGECADVYFIDGRWADVASGRLSHDRRETEETSILIGFWRILRDALNDPDPSIRAVAGALYGDFFEAFDHLARRLRKGANDA
ncbi:MAG: hypothetical protein OHK0022_07350 [Roseiflexaceae bacterium]